MTIFKGCLAHSLGFSGDAVVKNLPANAGDTRDTGSITGSGRFLGEGNGYQLQYSCPESSMDRGAWRATVHGVTKSQNDRMTKHEHRICLDVMECERREAKLGLALH